jgi:hypothetical protein
MVFTDDSIISAPYLTTRELAFPCSYARKAVLKSGKFDTLATKSGEVISAGREGDGADSALEADAGIWALLPEALAPFLISPSALTAMRTLSSSSSNVISLLTVEDGGVNEDFSHIVENDVDNEVSSEKARD